MNALRYIGVTGLLLTLGAAAPDDPTLGAMESELARSAHDLKFSNRQPAYYLSYWVIDFDQHDVEATLGTLVASDRDHGRRYRIEARVGSASFDNSNFLGGGGFFSDVFGQAAALSPRPAPQDDPFALRRALWLGSDSAYKSAVETLERKNAARQSEVQRKDDAPSFSPAPPTRLMVDERADLGSDADHEKYTQHISEVFREYPDVQTSSVHLVVSAERRYFVSTEGSRVEITTPYTELTISCRAQADDGMSLERSASLASLTTRPPDAEEAIAEARRLAKELVELRKAPVVDEYSGPVLFEGRAAAQIVNELLSEALSGTPPPKGGESLESPLSHKLGKRILPPTFSLVDDPTLSDLAGKPLLGHYVADDEGVPPQRTLLVERGRLRGFVMGRTPSKEITSSNGHGRNGLVGWARGRVANLILSTTNGMNDRALRDRFLQAVREDGQGYGLVITELEPRAAGSNGQVVPEPRLAYKVTLDNKKQLVRGAIIAAMSVRDLKDILAAGRTPYFFGYAAPSAGGFAIPTSVVSPGLLFEDVEIKQRPEPSKRPPLVPRPPLTPTKR